MAVTALTNATTYISGYDFTCDSNKAQVEVAVNELDATTFCSNGWKEVAAGLKSVAFNQSGFWQSAASQAVDPQAFPLLGTADEVHTFAASSTEGAVAYMFRAGKFSYKLGGTHGELAPYDLRSAGTNGQGVIRGTLAKAKGNVSATGALGTAFQLGAVGASQYLYGTFHVFTAGTTITVVLESDDNSDFSSATTRATFGPITTSGGSWATRVAGAITDDYYRLRVTAITGTFSVAGAIGIGS